MKCRIHQCHAACCYNVPFKDGELEKYADKIVNKVLYVQHMETVPPAVLPFTTECNFMEDFMKNKCPFLRSWRRNGHLFFIKSSMKNKCPFLRHDRTCNIYENRPEVCRLFGEIDELKCKYRKK